MTEQKPIERMTEEELRAEIAKLRAEREAFASKRRKRASSARSRKERKPREPKPRIPQGAKVIEL